MVRLLLLGAIIIIGWKLVSGRWPWERRESMRSQALFRARRLLGVQAGASHGEILEAHRRLIALVHPDRGGTSEQVHEANDARDLLLSELPYESPRNP